MILSTHAIVGGAIGSLLLSHPGIAFVTGFGSHFLLDAIPHWDYPIRSAVLRPGDQTTFRLDVPLVRDFLIIGADALVGTAGAMALCGFHWAVLFGAIGAILPDPLQILHDFLPYEPLRTLQRFHRLMHSNTRITTASFGAVAQLALIGLVAAVVWFKG